MPASCKFGGLEKRSGREIRATQRNRADKVPLTACVSLWPWQPSGSIWEAPLHTLFFTTKTSTGAELSTSTDHDCIADAFTCARCSEFAE